MPANTSFELRADEEGQHVNNNMYVKITHEMTLPQSIMSHTLEWAQEACSIEYI